VNFIEIKIGAKPIGFYPGHDMVFRWRFFIFMLPVAQGTDRLKVSGPVAGKFSLPLDAESTHHNL
jgi:hypothetical protein